MGVGPGTRWLAGLKRRAGLVCSFVFFFQAEDGIRDSSVTGVQTCALPISSVRGILVTEGVRGEGGILLNKTGRRFMFDDIPELYRNQTADNEEEGWKYTQGRSEERRVGKECRSRWSPYH